jgi:hypothetical protein
MTNQHHQTQKAELGLATATLAAAIIGALAGFGGSYVQTSMNKAVQDKSLQAEMMKHAMSGPNIDQIINNLIFWRKMKVLEFDVTDQEVAKFVRACIGLGVPPDVDKCIAAK